MSADRDAAPIRKRTRGAPPPPTIEELAQHLGMTPEHLREMGRRYQAYCLGSDPRKRTKGSGF